MAAGDLATAIHPHGPTEVAVLATLHSRSAASSIDRLVDVFAAEEKALVRTMLRPLETCTPPMPGSVGPRPDLPSRS